MRGGATATCCCHSSVSLQYAAVIDETHFAGGSNRTSDGRLRTYFGCGPRCQAPRPRGQLLSGSASRWTHGLMVSECCVRPILGPIRGLLLRPALRALLPLEGSRGL